MSENIVRKAHTQEPGNPGQFGTVNRPEGAPLSPVDHSVNVELSGSFRVDGIEQFGELPEYPTGLPEPRLSLDWDGGVRTIVELDNKLVSFWSGSDGDTYNSLEDLDQFGGATDDIDEEELRLQFIEWGDEVHKRIEANVYGATLAAVTGQVEATILALAQGKPAPARTGA